MSLDNGRLADILFSRKEAPASDKNESDNIHPEISTEQKINRSLYYYGSEKKTIIPIIERLQKKELQFLKKAEKDERRLENLSESLRCLEREVIYLRQEIIRCTANLNKKASDIVLFNSHIYASVSGKILTFKIPALLPKRTYFGQTKYIATEMEKALSEADLSGWDKGGKYFVIFVRFFGETISKNQLKDCDNVEEKFVIDSLKGTIFEDDDPFHVSLMQMNAEGDDTHTNVYVVPREDTPVFLDSLLKGDEKGL